MNEPGHGEVTSADGTTIAYRQYGVGPAIILVSGGYLAAQHYSELAAMLSTSFTVYVPDRRGRGRSGPPGDHYSIDRECEDLAAIIVASGARGIFGHSSGGLIALEAALQLPSVSKVAVYEPALSMYGTFADLTTWAPQFERELDQGKVGAAIVTFSKGVRASRGVDAIPRWLLVPLMNLYLNRQQKSVVPGEQSVAELIPLQRLDVQLFQETALRPGFSDLSADVLLMDGARTPPPVRNALTALQRTLPRPRRVTLGGVGHEAPLNGRGSPARVAVELVAFFDNAADNLLQQQRERPPGDVTRDSARSPFPDGGLPKVLARAGQTRIETGGQLTRRAGGYRRWPAPVEAVAALPTGRDFPADRVGQDLGPPGCGPVMRSSVQVTRANRSCLRPFRQAS